MVGSPVSRISAANDTAIYPTKPALTARLFLYKHELILVKIARPT
ncbi:MAG: hypothetical protein GQF41_2025 [Candidatus Rifleibacterium amylolyticum]|nr:MAG: hypothetical protein GQF41_2025 [Candidatus Rifleibacterium amylolyticum]